jgi:iron complex outermembrane recepter protein
VTVIDQDDISRSGMTTLPDLLRLVPGMDVAQLDGSKWAIGTRGFTQYFSSSLLVLVDGRTVFTPQFGGVLWNAQDYVLQDVDHVEAIRGAGASVWGSNAVNGVVNITTKSADQTQGWLISGLGGTDQQDGEVRYGGKLDSTTYYRVYTKYSDYDDSVSQSGGSAYDAWDSLQSGFRIDRYATPDDTLTFQGDIYNQNIHQTDSLVNLTAPFQTNVNDAATADGGNVLGRWTHIISDTSTLSVQAYYDRVDHYDLTLGYQQDTGDIEVQHNFALGERQQILWGGGYRFVSSRADGSSQIAFSPADQDLQTINGFVQDDLTLVPDRLHLFVGTRVEENSYAGLQDEPNARLLWTPNPRNSIWGAVSQSAQIPSRFDEEADIRFASFFNGSNTTLIQGTGNSSLAAEKLLSYELGYRAEPNKSFSLDLATFFDNYNDLIANEPGTPMLTATNPPVLVLPQPLANAVHSQTYGAEIQATWRVAENWRLIGSYTYLHVYPVFPTGGVLADDSASNQFQIRSYLDLTKNLQFNTALYYTGRQPINEVPAYFRLDANIDWRINPNLDIMIGAQNLLQSHHLETSLSSYVVQTEVPRSFFAKVTLQY